jgi:isocitrate dehydrogenase kinase/phosphatase
MIADVKIRTNSNREPGEEALPDWYFEDGSIFLPEELQYGLQLQNDCAHRCFRQQNADLLGVGYWEGVQQKLQRGEVPELRMYPRTAKLALDAR